ncbi:MAG: type II secretion system protein GspJ [Byssovorax sp.]
MTLLEVLISVSILALVATLIYGAFDGMAQSRGSLSQLNDRYHQGRSAIARMSRELQSAFLSLHQPTVIASAVRTTAFIGTNSGSSDRVDFNSFSHRRLVANAHESDQNELSYFLSRDPDRSDKYDLVRRESKELDIDPTKGGAVYVIAEDVESFDLTYLDPLTGEWTESWDTTQAAGQLNRLPMQIKIRLVLKGGRNGAPIKLETKVPIPMQTALTFARQ